MSRSKVKQMSEQLVQEMGWCCEKWRVKKEAEWSVTFVRERRNRKIRRRNGRSIQTCLFLLFQPPLSPSLPLISAAAGPPPLSAPASSVFCFFFFITLSSQLVICLAKGQTGCCTLQDCRHCNWNYVDRVDFVLSVSTKHTHKTTAKLKRVNSITETERICWFHEARFKECFFIYIRIWDQQKQNCQTSLFLVIK